MDRRDALIFVAALEAAAPRPVAEEGPRAPVDVRIFGGTFTMGVASGSQEAGVVP